MFDDPERYEHDGFYEEDTDYEDEYETDDSDYIVDDEEDENTLWDDEEEAADDLPEKKRRKRKNQVVLADNDTDTEETELSEQAMWQIAKEEQLNYAIDVYPHYGSDVEATLHAGYDIRHGLIGPGVYASHNYERSHMDGVRNTFELLKTYVTQ